MTFQDTVKCPTSVQYAHLEDNKKISCLILRTEKLMKKRQTLWALKKEYLVCGGSSRMHIFKKRHFLEGNFSPVHTIRSVLMASWASVQILILIKHLLQKNLQTTHKGCFKASNAAVQSSVQDISP